jgi:hypothetical protein
MIDWKETPTAEDDGIYEYHPPKKPWYWYPKQIILLIFVMISFVLIHNGRLIPEEGNGLILSGMALMVVSTLLMLEEPRERIPDTQIITHARCIRCKKEYMLDFKEGDTVYSKIVNCADCEGDVNIIEIYSVEMMHNGAAKDKEEELRKKQEEALKLSNIINNKDKINEIMN